MIGAIVRVNRVFSFFTKLSNPSYWQIVRRIKKISVEGGIISDHMSFFVFKDLQMEMIYFILF